MVESRSRTPGSVVCRVLLGKPRDVHVLGHHFRVEIIARSLTVGCGYGK